MQRPAPLQLPATLLALGLLAGCGEPVEPAAPGRPEAGPEGPSAPDPGQAQPLGRWLPAREAAPADAATAAALSELEAIGYVSGSRAARSAGGARTLDAARVQPGLNLVVSGHGPEAQLMDLDGRVLHAWHKTCHEVFPALRDANAPRYQFFRRAHLLPDGSLLAIFEGLAVVKLAPDSSLAWAWPGRVHHDLDVRPDGRIVALTRQAHVVPRLDAVRPLIEDFLVELSPDGELLGSVSLLAALEATEGPQRMAERAQQSFDVHSGDVFHANTAQWLFGERVAWWPLAREGDVLVSLRNIDMLALVDMHERRFAWQRTGSWRGQHQPELLPSGRMLLFDNAPSAGRSRALEIDPISCEETWSWSGSDEDPLWSGTCGSVQPLPNGNVLVVESDGGRAFEVSREGAVVWRFDSPWRAGERGELVATLFDCVRLPPDAAAAWLR